MQTETCINVRVQIAGSSGHKQVLADLPANLTAATNLCNLPNRAPPLGLGELVGPDQLPRRGRAPRGSGEPAYVAEASARGLPRWNRKLQPCGSAVSLWQRRPLWRCADVPQALYPHHWCLPGGTRTRSAAQLRSIHPARAQSGRPSLTPRQAAGSLRPFARISALSWTARTLRPTRAGPLEISA